MYNWNKLKRRENVPKNRLKKKSLFYNFIARALGQEISCFQFSKIQA